MNRSLQAAMAAAALVVAGHAAAQITLYEGEGFRGRAVSANGEVRDLHRMEFDNRASSIVVEHGRWVVCEHPRFEGRCVILRRGSYPTLRDFGMNNMISSVAPANGRHRYEEMAPPIAEGRPIYEYRERPGERVFDVPVSSVHAVVGPPNQRCWIERQQAAAPSNQPNVGGAIVGGLVGGILGHQVGGGSGKDLATAGGAVAGAVIGSNVANQNGGQVVTRDVQRCQNVTSTTPEYYDVMYVFRGTEHHVQMSTPPGQTIRVNERGEPRM